MSDTLLDLEELSITWQRIVSCHKNKNSALYQDFMSKLTVKTLHHLREYEYDIDMLTKAYQRITSVSTEEHEVTNLLLSQISSKL